MAVEDRGVTDCQGARVVEHDNLCDELVCDGRRHIGGTADIAAADVPFADATDVEPDVVARERLRDLLMVHLDGLDFTLLVRGHEADLHPLLHDTGLDTADGHRSDTGDGVDILDRETHGQGCGLLGFLKRVERIEHRRSLVPWGICTGLRDVVADERTDRDEADAVGLVTDNLEQLG